MDFDFCSSTRTSGLASLLDRLRWTLDHCCINITFGRLCIMCYGSDRLAGWEAKIGKLWAKQAPQCFSLGFWTDYAGLSIIVASAMDFDFFSSARTSGLASLLNRLRWTLDHCCINTGHGRLCIMSYVADRPAGWEAKIGKIWRKQAPQCFALCSWTDQAGCSITAA